MSRLLQLARAQDGIALATTMMLLLIMMGFGGATLAYVDGQSRASGRERIGESGFNLAEGALSQQVFTLARSWPGSATAAYPSVCNGTVSDNRCPDQQGLRLNYNTVDYSTAPTWQTQVRDNQSAGKPVDDYYSPAVLSSPSWDANHDGKVWVRAKAKSRTRTRVVIGMVQQNLEGEVLPHASIIAGSFETTNNGNKAIVCTKFPTDLSGKDCTSSSPLQGAVQLRCSPLTATSCLDIRGQVQVQPYNIQGAYAGSPAMTADELQRMRARAIADGTYYASTCPVSPAGTVVFVESANCSYNGGTQNSQAAPGLFIVKNGTLNFNGNITFWGLVYMVNAQNSSGTVMTTGGTAAIFGGVLIDGPGKLSAGSSKVNISFYDAAYTAIHSYGGAGLVQNKWREIPCDLPCQQWTD